MVSKRSRDIQNRYSIVTRIVRHTLFKTESLPRYSSCVTNGIKCRNSGHMSKGIVTESHAARANDVTLVALAAGQAGIAIPHGWSCFEGRFALAWALAASGAWPRPRTLTRTVAPACGVVEHETDTERTQVAQFFTERAAPQTVRVHDAHLMVVRMKCVITTTCSPDALPLQMRSPRCSRRLVNLQGQLPCWWWCFLSLLRHCEIECRIVGSSVLLCQRLRHRPDHRHARKEGRLLPRVERILRCRRSCSCSRPEIQRFVHATRARRMNSGGFVSVVEIYREPLPG